MIFSFFHNMLVIIGFLFIAIKVNDYFISNEVGNNIKIGAFSIFASIASMLTIVDSIIYNGMFFDMRSIPIFCVSYGYGWAAGIISGIIPSLYRIYLGGTGVTQGVIIDILVPLLFGSFFYKFKDKRLVDNTFNIKKILIGYLVYSVIKTILTFITLPISYLFWLKINTIMIIFSFIALLSVMLVVNDYIKTKYLMKQMEEKQKRIEKLNEELKIASIAKDKFIANISHELKTPLNITMTYLEYLLEEQEGELNKEQKEILEIAYSNSERLEYLIRDLLDYSLLESRKVKFNYTQININEFINNLINDRILLMKNKNINIVLHVSPKDVIIITDVLRLRQVIDNLIDNALKFSDGGDIQIKVKEKESNIEIIIRDSGIGIDQDKINKVFEPFYQIDDTFTKKYKGVGLGLSIVKKIINALGGEISVKNNLDKGCRFKITIPYDCSAEEGQNEKNIYS